MDQDLLAQLVIVALVAVLALVVAVAVLATKIARLRRDYTQAVGEDEREGLFAAVRTQVGQLEALRADLGVVHANTEMLRDLIRDTVSRVGVVRYDAFEDMGGALSFSAALLDERGDGVVVSAINGRSETRTYAKAIEGGSSEHHLSAEEEAAITQAMAGPAKAETTVVGSGRRRRRAG
jgi:hypothetical protein